MSVETGWMDFGEAWLEGGASAGWNFFGFQKRQFNVFDIQMTALPFPWDESQPVIGLRSPPMSTTDQRGDCIYTVVVQNTSGLGGYYEAMWLTVT